MCSDYGIVFDRAVSWNFGNDFARNIVIFVVDNNSSSHADNRKNTFLVLDEEPTSGTNGSFGSPEKKICYYFCKESKKFCLSLHYNCDNSYLIVNAKKIFLSLKPITKMLTIQFNFV